MAPPVDVRGGEGESPALTNGRINLGLTGVIIPINNVGSIGVVADQQPHELPLHAWNDARNIRFREGFAEKIAGQQAVFDPPTVAPYFLLPITSTTAYWWIYAGLTKVYAQQGATHFNITRQTAGNDVNYAATADLGWTGCVLGGVAILNNGVDGPQKWPAISGSQRLEALDYVTGVSSWTSLSYKCGAMRAFKNFLVALDVTKSSTRYPHLVKWSHPAAPLTVPDSWDEASAVKDTGEVSLSQSNGFVVDCAQLRDVNIVYKEDTIWGMQFVGGLSIFRFYPIFNQLGILSRNCAVEFFSGKHFVFGNGDIVVHDGQSMTSILSKRMRRWLFDRIDSTYRTRSFVVVNPKHKECWACYSTAGNAAPNEALIWNWETSTLGVRQLPGIAFGQAGIVDTSAATDTWASDNEPWSSDSSVWGARSFSLSEPAVILAGSTDTKLYQADETEQFAGVDINAYLERTGLGIPPRQDQSLPDVTRQKFLRAVYPRIEGVNGRAVNVRVGRQDFVDGPVTWLEPQSYVIGSTRRIDVRVSGRMFAVRFEATGNFDWRLHGYDLDADFIGMT